MKSWLFPTFFLIYLFSDQLLGTILSITGMTIGTGMLQLIFIPIAIVSYAILLRDFSKLRNPNVSKILLITAIFAALYYFSSFTSNYVPYAYYARLLRFLSICVAGVAIGIHLASYPCFEKIEKLLPFFIAVFIIVLGRYGYEANMNKMMIKEEDGEGIGLNYQSFSYYMAIEYTYCLYFLFFSNIRGSRYYRFMRIPMAIMCLASLALCIIGGGRGPFVYATVVTLVFIHSYQRTRRASLKNFWSIALLIIAFVFVSIEFNIFGSAGFYRVSHSLTEDNTRSLLYATAWSSFIESPLVGHGFGSVWWTVGWACHNMFLDLLAEGGIIGAGIVLYFFLISGKYIWKRTKMNTCYFLILFVFLESIVENTFSGYWVSSQAIWFSVAFALTDMKAKNYKLIITR